MLLVQIYCTFTLRSIMPLSDVLHHRTLATDILYGLKHRLTNGEHGSDGEPSVKLNVFLRILLRLPQYIRTNLLFVNLFSCPAVAYRVLLQDQALVAAIQHL
jgi:hypothetical protein